MNQENQQPQETQQTQLQQPTIKTSEPAPTPPQTPDPVTPQALENNNPNITSTSPSSTILVSSDPTLQKLVKNSSLALLIMGVILIPVSLFLFLFVNLFSVIDLAFAIIYVIIGIKLRSADITIAKSIKYMQIAAACIIVTILLIIALSIVTGKFGNVGLIQILSLFFISKVFSYLYDKGLTTSRSLASAKLK